MSTSWTTPGATCHNTPSCNPPRDEILIEKRKWDGSVAGREEARLLTADLDTFVWVVAPGSTRVKPRQGSAEVVSDPEVWLASRACSFVVCARAAGHDSIDSVEVHAALLAEPGSDSELVWVDLDLDLLWNPTDDTVSLKDFEDLVRRWDEMLYPDQLVRKAWNAIGEALTRIHRSEWPFDGTLETYLRDAHHATTNPPTRTLRSRERHIDVASRTRPGIRPHRQERSTSSSSVGRALAAAITRLMS